MCLYDVLCGSSFLELFVIVLVWHSVPANLSQIPLL